MSLRLRKLKRVYSLGGVTEKRKSPRAALENCLDELSACCDEILHLVNNHMTYRVDPFDDSGV